LDIKSQALTKKRLLISDLVYALVSHGSGGYHHHVYWKQDNLFFEIEARGFEKEEIIKMANSMSIGQVIRASQTQQSYKIAKRSKSQDLHLNGIISYLKQTTKIPILLPSNLPTKSLKLCPKTESDGYAITLVSDKCPFSSQASYVGTISATVNKILKPIGENSVKVRLAGGITGYYTPRAYKVPPSVDWIYKGTLYSIQIKEYADGKNHNRNSTEAKAYLLSLANSAIEAGSR
jgi:hypothetical protein